MRNHTLWPREVRQKDTPGEMESIVSHCWPLLIKVIRFHFAIPSRSVVKFQGLRRNPRGLNKRNILLVECKCIHGSSPSQIVKLLQDIWTFVNLSSATLNPGLHENKNRTCVRYTKEKRRERIKLPHEHRHRDIVRPKLGHAKHGATSVRCM